jgi:hypothetical protein
MRILLPGNLTKKTASEKIRRFRKLGSVLSLEKLGQTFFAVIMTKTPLLMGFLVYELNCHLKNDTDSDKN